MAETFAQRIAREVNEAKQKSTTATAAQRLQHASIEDTFVPVKDLEGQVVATWGKQPDGSFGQVVRNSPEQPTPSAPILPTPVEGERVPNNFPVEWDGNVVTLTVPEVHGYTGVYYQMVENEAAADPSQAKLAGTIRDRLGGATTIVVPGTGLIAVWFQMVGADRVTKGPFSAPSFVTVTARVDAQDIADRLAAFADGELPDGAYNNLMARLAEFLYVRADQIDVNSLAADTAFIGLLETAGIKLVDEAAGRRTEVSGQGIQVFGTDGGEIITQLGTFTDDIFTIMGANGPSVSMTRDGGVSAVQISSETDPHFGGKALAGRHFNTARWNVVDNALEYMPLGVLKQYRRVFNGEVSNASGSQVGISVIHLEEKVKPGRLYRIKCDNFEMGDRASYWMEAFYTTSSDPDVRPEVPTQLTPSQSVWMPRVPGRVPTVDSGTGTVLAYDKVIEQDNAYWIRIILTVGNSTGVSNVFGSSFRHSAHFTLEDIGPSTGQKGYPLNRGIRTRDEVGPLLPEDLSVVYPVADTATYTLNTSTGVATRQYLGGEPRFGRWDNGTYYMTLARMNNWESQAGTRTTAQFNLSVASWVNQGRGHIIQMSIPTFNDFPASFNYETETVSMPEQRNVARWSPRTVNPEGEALAALLGKPHGLIALGRTGFGLLTDLPASGRLHTANTNARLSTEL